MCVYELLQEEKAKATNVFVRGGGVGVKRRGSSVSFPFFKIRPPWLLELFCLLFFFFVFFQGGGGELHKKCVSTNNHNDVNPL